MYSRLKTEKKIMKLNGLEKELLWTVLLDRDLLGYMAWHDFVSKGAKKLGIPILNL